MEARTNFAAYTFAQTEDLALFFPNETCEPQNLTKYTFVALIDHFMAH